MWSSIVFEKMIMSSKYTIANFHQTELTTMSIARLNELGAFVNPKVIRTK